MQQVSVSTLTGASLYGSPKLRELLQTHHKTILQQMSHASDVRMFLSDLTNLLVCLLDQAALPCQASAIKKIIIFRKGNPKIRKPKNMQLQERLQQCLQNNMKC